MSRWSEEKTADFVRLYRQCPCLWNPQLESYKRRSERFEAHKYIQKHFNDSNMTLTDIKNKINNLRRTFHQELKKVRESREVEAAGGEIYKPKLFWFDQMNSFLGDRIEYRDSTINELEQPNSPESILTFIKTESISSDLFYSDTLDVADIQPHQYSIPTSPQLSTETVLKSQRFEENTSNSLFGQKSVEMNVTTNEDEFYYFGMNIAAQLRQMPLDNALKMQAEIQSLLSRERRLIIQEIL